MVTSFRIPKDINMNAENLLEVTKEKLILEPPLTRHFSTVELLKFKELGHYDVNFECHSQV